MKLLLSSVFDSTNKEFGRCLIQSKHELIRTRYEGYQIIATSEALFFFNSGGKKI